MQIFQIVTLEVQRPFKKVGLHQLFFSREFSSSKRGDCYLNSRFLDFQGVSLMGFPSHFFSSFHQGWFWQAVVHYIEAWKKWPGLCWWRILASKNNGKGKERLVCLDDCIGTSFFLVGWFALDKIIFVGMRFYWKISVQLMNLLQFTVLFCVTFFFCQDFR